MVPGPTDVFRLPDVPGPLDPPLADLEARLHAVTVALRDGDPQVLEQRAAELQASLAQTLAGLRALHARDPSTLALVRGRLARAAAELQAQRAAVARAESAVQRGAQVLFPPVAGVYGAQGQNQRPGSTGSVIA